MVALLSAASTDLCAQPSLVILVRHSERSTAPADDPVLTAAGATRARELARALAAVRLGSIVVTRYQRTRLTADPVAKAQRLTPVVVPDGGSLSEHVAAVADLVRMRPYGEVVLVVGHTTTIPAIVAALDGPQLPDLCESEYSSLFLLHFSGNGKPHLVRAKYGADAPGAAACSGDKR